MPKPVIAQAGKHGHRWLARTPAGVCPEIAVFGLTEDEARVNFATSWAAWEQLGFDGQEVRPT